MSSTKFLAFALAFLIVGILIRSLAGIFGSLAFITLVMGVFLLFKEGIGE